MGSNASPMKLLHLSLFSAYLCFLCGEVSCSVQGTRVKSESSKKNESNVVGMSLNVFARYGFMGLSMKVFPERFNWLFKEKVFEVFKQDSYEVMTEPRPEEIQYDNFIRVDFCEDLQDLLNAYFDGFSVEGVPEAHKLFTSSVYSGQLARFLGLHQAYFGHDYFFVLLRRFRRNSRYFLKGSPELNDEVKAHMEDLKADSSIAVMRFFERRGTHVVQELQVGNLLYQVCVLSKVAFGRMKKHVTRVVENVMTKATDIQPLKNNSFFLYLERYREVLEEAKALLAREAEHFGRLRLASGSIEFADLMILVNYDRDFFIMHDNIFFVMDLRIARETINNITDQVVLGMKLTKITQAANDLSIKGWLLEILDNILALFYNTM